MKKQERNFIFSIDPETKKIFKSMCAKNGLTMSDVLNDMIKNVMYLDKYELKCQNNTKNNNN